MERCFSRVDPVRKHRPVVDFSATIRSLRCKRERILFTVDDDAIRAYVQVYYDGPADDFAWVVPVATVPEVGVGTDEVFTAWTN